MNTVGCVFPLSPYNLIGGEVAVGGVCKPSTLTSRLPKLHGLGWVILKLPTQSGI